MSAVTRGFTLIETLVALAIAAAAAAVVLANVHGLYRRAERQQQGYAATTALLNDMARLSRSPWREGLVEVAPDRLRIRPKPGTELPMLTAVNFSVRAEQGVPPLQVAYTPFQRFGLEKDGFSLHFLAPALVPEGQ